MQFEESRKQEKLFEQKVAERFEAEAADRKEQEKRLMALIEDRANAIRTELGKEAAIREEGVDSLKSCMEVQIKQLKNRTIFLNYKKA